MEFVARRIRRAHQQSGQRGAFDAADAQGIKERIAMDIERYGDVKVVSIVSDRGREEQLRMKGAKL